MSHRDVVVLAVDLVASVALLSIAFLTHAAIWFALAIAWAVVAGLFRAIVWQSRE